MISFGIDHVEEYKEWFADARVGLLTNITGRNSKNQDTIEVLREVCNLTALFAPEHGIRGDFGAGEVVNTYEDPATKLPVYSLYSTEKKRFTQEMLDCFDILVYDIQDIGIRFYTYISTLHHAIEDCGKNQKTLIVLDRPNPLGGNIVEGGILDREYESFVGCYPMPIRYGLTSGEAALMMNEEEGFGCEVKVVPCRGWNRDMLFPEWDKIWIPPSVALTNFDATLIYPGTCFVEGTNLSEGRGTAGPFRMVGAPFMDAEKLMNEFNQVGLEGVMATPIWFTPTASKEKDVKCAGIFFHVTDQKAFRPVTLGVVLLDIIRKLYPNHYQVLPPYREGGRQMLTLLTGGNRLIGDWNRDKVLEEFNEESKAFADYKVKYHLY